MNQASFYFRSGLTVFLPVKWREVWVTYAFNQDQSVKHLVESMGVPHTEVGKILINGQPVGFDSLVSDGDHVEVFPHEDRQPGEPVPQSEELEPRFVLDNHLGKLATYLRMLGFDCWYENDYQDDQLEQIACQEQRILLSRDHLLFMRKRITAGYWLRSQIPEKQLQEVMQRFNLTPKIQPLSRCMRCNHPLTPVSKAQVIDRLEPLTKKYFEVFSLCPECKQVYWQGSHYHKMIGFIDRLLKGL